MKIVTYSTNKNSLNESLKKTKNGPTIKQMMQDISTYVKDKELLKTLADNVRYRQKLLDYFYKEDTEEQTKKIKGKETKVDVPVYILNKEKVDRWFKVYDQKTFTKEKIIDDIKDIIDEMGRNKDVRQIFNVIVKRFREEEKETGQKKGIKSFLLKNFYTFDKDKKKYIISADKTSKFLDENVDARELLETPETDVGNIQVKEAAVLYSLGLPITKENYARIKNDNAEIGENGGYLYEVQAPLIDKNGKEIYNDGDLFWLGDARTRQKFNFAFYLLIAEFEKNGLLKYKPDEINVIEDEFSEYPWDEEAKKSIVEELTEFSKQDDPKYGNKLAAFAVTRKIISKDDIKNMSKEEIFNKCLDACADYINNNLGSMSKYLTYKKGKDWYKQDRETYDEYFNGTDWALEYLSENNGANVDTVISWYQIGQMDRFVYDNKTWYMVELDELKLRDIDFIE